MEGGEEDLLFSKLPGNPDPNSIAKDVLAAAEETASQIVACIHPTLDSEEVRKDIIDYVQRLIRTSLGFEVFPYGSVPLKTYLPDGDIDLTALSTPNFEQSLARHVLAVLQAEEHNENAEYEVKDTQFIDAEVKLVKCLVQKIVIDISFNQLGGLCTLCFLEQVDRVVGKDHLFKRSIILIKAWCYYESRILGAHHGLISTYALETLVLYIFHLFNSSLDGPLMVLYRFLDCFSHFDWDKYCISLDGPVLKSSLPEIVVEKPENGQKDVMLSEEFLKNCMQMFSVPSRVPESNVRTFQLKNLNIIDPLKENNNLGRSVHRGNYYRIRSAFRYGARKLGRILSLPRERVADEIKKFFSNTLERHGRNDYADVQSPSLIIANDLGTLSPSSNVGPLSEDDICSKKSNYDFDDEILGVDEKYSMGPTENSYSELKTPCLRSAYDSSLSVRHCYAPDLSFSQPSSETGNLGNRFSSQSTEDTHLCINNDDHVSPTNSAISSQNGNVSEKLSLDFRNSGPVGSVSDTETLNPLADLSGDYDSHIRSLLYGQCCLGYALSAHVIGMNPTILPSQCGDENLWETVGGPIPYMTYSCPQVSSDGFLAGAPFYYPTTDSFPLPTAAFDWEDRQRGHVTGTYFPTNRPSLGRGWNRAAGTDGHSQSVHSNSSVETKLSEGFPELQLAQSLGQDRGKSDLSRISWQPTQATSQHSAPGNSTTNVVTGAQRKLEFGSFGPMPVDPSAPITATQRHNTKVGCVDNEKRAEKSFHLMNEDEFPPLSASIS